jgi:hypothetical protein
MVTEDTTPDVGRGRPVYIAHFDGVINWKGDAIFAPVVVGIGVAEEFEDYLDERLKDWDKEEI